MRAALLLLLASALGFAPAPLPRPERRSEKGDLSRMEGTWAVVEQRVNGNTTTSKGDNIRIRGARWEYVSRGEVRSEWDLKLDPSASPRAMDYHGVGRSSGILLAIYRLEGDTLTVCYNSGDKTRPGDFDGNGSAWVMVLRR